MGKSKNKRKNGKIAGQKQVHLTPQQLIQQKLMQQKPQLNIAVWGATPHVITGFGIVMKEILQGLYRNYPGVYNIFQVGINYHGDFADELAVTGGLERGRFRQWPAKVPLPGGGINLYGQPKFLQLLKDLNGVDLDCVFLFEDPFWVGGTVPGMDPNKPFALMVKEILAQKGLGHVPVVAYFPIDGIPKPAWIKNIATYIDLPITYLNFGHKACVDLEPKLQQRLRIIPHGVNTKEFFPIPQHELRTFKRAMFGETASDKFMFMNVNRNQLRKLVPSNLIAFKEFQKYVPESFLYLNMQPVDVGWNLPECCAANGLVIGRDVFFPPEFDTQKGLSVEDLNKLFNCADCLTSTATGGGWELAISQAFATRTVVLAPDNTAHTDLCGSQTDLEQQRGILYKSGSDLKLRMIFPNDNEVIRPIPDLDDMVAKMKFIYDNPGACRKVEQNAFDWAIKNLNWEKNIVPQFHKAFVDAKNVKNGRIQQIMAQRQQQLTPPQSVTQPIAQPAPAPISAPTPVVAAPVTAPGQVNVVEATEQSQEKENRNVSTPQVSLEE